MTSIAIAMTQQHDRRWWLLLFGMFILLMAPPAVRADIYFWQDDQGVIHFSNQNAPPAASLYMREPEPKVAAPAGVPAVSPSSVAIDEISEKLARTQRQLERALERADDLTDKIEDSRQEAAVAAAVAQQAAQVSIVNAGQSAQTPAIEVHERVAYYAVPFISKSTHGFRHPDQRHSKFKRHKIKHHRWKPHREQFGGKHRFDRHRSAHPKTIRINYKSGKKAQHRGRITSTRRIR